MGNQSPSRRPPADLTASYDAAADSWDTGPGPIYEPLAQALVAAAPVPLTGRTILDLGAGTGADATSDRASASYIASGPPAQSAAAAS